MKKIIYVSIFNQIKLKIRIWINFNLKKSQNPNLQFKIGLLENLQQISEIRTQIQYL